MNQNILHTRYFSKIEMSYSSMNGPSAVNIFDVIVIGGGLSGLVVAKGLIGHARVPHWKLLEASDRLGGRLVNASPTVPIDMGGAWIWPNHQPHIRDLVVSELKLPVFPQPDDPTSTRIEGGAVRIIEQLTHQIKVSSEDSNSVVESETMSRIALNTPITSCTLLNDHNHGVADKTLVQLATRSGEVFLSRKVVFAIPPKIISDSITFDPPLSKTKAEAMALSTTWMAGVTKVALLYRNKFWTSDATNSGLPASMGPAFQVYDASTKDGSIAALTCFAHVPDHDPSAQSNDATLAAQVATQIGKYWKFRGVLECDSQVLSYSSFHVYRWPMNPFISGDETRPTHIHPHPMPRRDLSTPEWDNRLLFAGTETDLTSPGVMEGAVGAAKRVLKSLLE